jgi:hypothetical protein
MTCLVQRIVLARSRATDRSLPGLATGHFTGRIASAAGPSPMDRTSLSISAGETALVQAMTPQRWLFAAMLRSLARTNRRDRQL